MSPFLFGTNFFTLTCTTIKLHDILTGISCIVERIDPNEDSARILLNNNSIRERADLIFQGDLSNLLITICQVRPRIMSYL